MKPDKVEMIKNWMGGSDMMVTVETVRCKYLDRFYCEVRSFTSEP